MGDSLEYFCDEACQKRPRDEGEDYDAHLQTQRNKIFNQRILRALKESEHVLSRVSQSRPRSVVGEDDIKRYGKAYEISKTKEYLDHQDVKRSKIEEKEHELCMRRAEGNTIWWELRETLRVVEEKLRRIDEELEGLEEERACDARRFDMASSKLDELRCGSRL